MIIAVDGPAASGKGTLARRLARHFNLGHLDTGKLYRAAALHALENGGDPADPAVAEAGAKAVRAADLGDPRLGDEAVARGASVVAAIPAVRQALFAFQRDFARHPPGGAAGAVLDGRDIGTVICPDADAKLFITAGIEARAARRFKELRDSGKAAIYEAVLQDMKDRDARDGQRRAAPMVPADDAFVLDTTTLDADAAFAAALDFIGRKLAAAPAKG
ncbi:MAG TPA: (d)CMP kinase [Stellaceae bacterium]|jgi:CMP/dCMP kinase|nr:(d)CMP kinase [Stellaceae bacterium]